MTAHVDTFCLDNLPPRSQWPDFLRLPYPSTLNCATELLDATVARFGAERLALLTDTGKWSYGELLDTANRLAHVLRDDLGVVPGNRVLLRGYNSPWLVACWFAVMKVGAVAVTTMPLLRTGELSAIVVKAELSLALCDGRLLDELAAVPGVTVVTDTDLDRLAAGKPAVFSDVPTAADDICLIAFTSGTTGQPKGCMHAHQDVLAIADTFSTHVVKPRPDDLFAGSPPLAFTFGLGGLVVFPLRAGAAALLLEAAPPDKLAEGIARHRATVCFTAPTAYRAMSRLDGADFSSLRRGVSAGETLPRATWDAWHSQFGLDLIDGIGATEMLHIFISASDDLIRPGATGICVPGYEARVIGDDGAPVADGSLGRLAVRGPTGCRYLADPRQKSYVVDGWNVTGDAYVRDGDGYYWFQSRADDLIISAGYNIAGPEVEDALLRHPDVVECGVVGKPDEERGSIVAAYVVLRPGVAQDATALQDHVKATIAPYKYPREVVFVESLPKTQTGKLQRYKLREMAAISSFNS